MKNLFKKKKGITLIALVITIIVMLILVAVTLSLSVNGGLFGYAGRAAKDTELAKNNEMRIAEGAITVDGITYESMDSYKASLNCEHDWSNEEIIKEATCEEEGEHILTCSKCGAKKREKIKKLNHVYTNNNAWEIIAEEGKETNTCRVCGQLVKRYIVGSVINGYDPTNNKTITTSYTSLGSSNLETPGEYGDGSTGNGNSNQKFTLNGNSNKLTWKILGEDEGQLIITPTRINQDTISFKGRAGYAHCIEELNNVCSIYGQGTYADTTKFNLTKDIENTDGTLARQETIPNASGARSINIEDLIRLGFEVTEESLTVRKDAVSNKIIFEASPDINSSYETFLYWNEYTNNATKPYTFIELNPGERVTINIIKSMSGKINDKVKSMLANFYKYNGNSSYTVFFLANRSYNLNYDSDKDLIPGLIDHAFITASRGQYNTFGVGLDTCYIRSSGYSDELGLARLIRPVVYLRKDISLDYDEQTGEYTINS